MGARAGVLRHPEPGADLPVAIRPDEAQSAGVAIPLQHVHGVPGETVGPEGRAITGDDGRLDPHLPRGGVVRVLRHGDHRRRPQLRSDEHGDDQQGHRRGERDVDAAPDRRAHRLDLGCTDLLAFVDPARAIPEHAISAPFGNPADHMGPVALRPRLATGVLVRGPACAP